MTLLTVALNNLRRRKGRAAFLVAGLLIGVGTVVALISITQSMTGQTKANLQSFGANIVVTPRAKDVTLSYGGITAGGVSVGQQSLSPGRRRRASAPSRAAPTSRRSRRSWSARSQVKGRRALLLGVQPEQQFKLKRWWSVGSGHAPTNDHELIAGAAAARTLGLAMGDYVRIGGRRFTVTGVLRETGSQDDSLLIVDLGAVQRVLRQPGKVTLVEIAALYAGAPVDRIAGEIGAALPQAKVTAMQEAVKSRQHAVDQFRRFSYAIVGVVIAIEALVVFLTVMGSVSERTREIGVFRAIGFRRVHITRLILIEAVIASTVAGVLGYAAGMAVTYVVLPLRRRQRRGGVGAAARPRRRRPGRRHRRTGVTVSGAARRQDGSDRGAARALTREASARRRGYDRSDHADARPTDEAGLTSAPTPRPADERAARFIDVRGLAEDLRRRRRARARPPRPGPRRPRGLVPRRDGPVRLRQEHLPRHARRPQPPDRRADRRRRHRPLRAPRRAARGLPPRVPGLRLPVVQPRART